MPATPVRVIGLTDYHAHALPTLEGGVSLGGIARTIAYLKAARARTPHLLALCGGDMLNRHAPLWSDVYMGIEWAWFNGLLDAMALGNHDLDYGPAVFARRRTGLQYPILSANFVHPRTYAPLLTTPDGIGGAARPYAIRRYGPVRIGLLALAGTDFDALVAPADRPADGIFRDRLATARFWVQHMRAVEGVHAVIAFGHASTADDVALAHAVPGIDLILGSHSHHKAELSLLPGSATYYVSAHHYLTHLVDVTLHFAAASHTLGAITGGLVVMDDVRPEDEEIAQRVALLHAALHRSHPHHFAPIGHSAIALSCWGSETGETVLGNWACDAVRRATDTDVTVLPAMAFRAGLPAGVITANVLTAAFPYPNPLVHYILTGTQLLQLVRLIAVQHGTPDFCQTSGLRVASDYRVSVWQPDGGDTADAGHYVPVVAAQRYSLSTIVYLASVSPAYRAYFATLPAPAHLDKTVAAVLEAAVRTATSITATVDGRWQAGDTRTLRHAGSD